MTATSDRIRLRLLTGDADEMAELQRVLEAAPGYAQRVTGLPPGASDAQSTFSMLPPGKSYDDKFVYGIERDGSMVGCIDVVRGWPDDATAVLGLLLVDERLHRRGIGAAAYRLLEDIVTAWPECRRMRLNIVARNEAVALPFWTRMGFTPTGETKPHRYANVESTTAIYGKTLAR